MYIDGAKIKSLILSYGSDKIIQKSYSHVSQGF
jgi:hypothetical protein